MSKEIWPAPRDARTDPPKEGDSQNDKVLACGGKYNRWVFEDWDKVSAYWYWTPCPPIPPTAPPKSDAELAWEAYCGPDNEIPWLRDDAHAKALFIAGYNAKGAK